MNLSLSKIKKFQRTVWNYYRTHKRAMPWRETHDPYKILVSEVMLQQTQVDRVIPKYDAFIKEFPKVGDLARAPLLTVLKVWSGLGYNRRALFLKRAAETILSLHKGVVPNDFNAIEDLPGVGKATAGAICVYAFGQKQIFVETNIRTVFIHTFFTHSKRKISDEEICGCVEETLPKENIREWFYALMDYGAMLKQAGVSAHHKSRMYKKQNVFQGSKRQLRGAILKILQEKEVTISNLIQKTNRTKKEVEDVVTQLSRENFLAMRGGRVYIKDL